MMRICLIAPQHQEFNTNGMQTFNATLAQALQEMGHRVEQLPPFLLDTFSHSVKEPGRQKISFDKNSRNYFSLRPYAPQPAQAFHGYDAVIVSGVHFDYGKILRAAEGKHAIVWTHGMRVSPLNTWSGEEMRRPGVFYACINDDHLHQAKIRGFESNAVAIRLPVPFQPRPVQPARGFCAAVGSLDPVKKYERIAEIAQCMRRQTKIFGAALNQDTKQMVDEAPFLEYCGLVSHQATLDNIAGADFLLHAATEEGGPLAVVEAMGLGVPVIVPDTQLYRRFVDVRRNVLLDPNLPVGRQLAAADLRSLCSIANRRALAAQTHGRFGLKNFKRQLAEMLK